MAGVEVRDFGSPDETRSPDKTTQETLKVGGALVGRGTMQPGWRWSEADLKAGDVYNVEPGHDAWVVGGEPYVAVEFNADAVATFAKG